MNLENKLVAKSNITEIDFKEIKKKIKFLKFEGQPYLGLPTAENANLGPDSRKTGEEYFGLFGLTPYNLLPVFITEWY